MDRQFLNSSTENCDPQLCLGQGHFNNLQHNHMRHNKPSVLTSTTNLKDVTALRRIDPVFFPQGTSNNIPCSYHKQPVDTSGLKCPIIMMNNPFQRQTDRDRTTGDIVVENSVARDIPYAQQCTGLARPLLAGSEEPAASSANHYLQATQAVYRVCHNDVSREPTHRTRQHQLVPSSENQIYRVPQNICNYTHNNNEAEMMEYNDQYFPNDIHQGQCVQYHNNPTAHSPHHVPPHGWRPGHDEINQYPHNNEESLHSMDLVLYNQDHNQHPELYPRVTREAATKDDGFMAFNPLGNLHRPPHLRSEPILTAMTSQYGHNHGIRQVHGTIQGSPATNRAAFNGNSMFDFSPCAAANCGHHQMPGRGYLQNADIRRGERYNIQSYLLPGKVLQVHGAPMTGKSTIVRQAISDAISNRIQTGQLRVHHITCKEVTRFSDFLDLIAQSWYPQYSRWIQQNTDSVLKLIGSFLQKNPLDHHILVFHKCENLRENPHGQKFLEFLTMIVNELATLSISIVFTTYKYYWTPPKMSIGEVEIDVLSVTDIMSLLQYYVPHIDDCVTYANVLVKAFCFPEAVRLIAEEYLADRNCHVAPEQLEKIIKKDTDLLSLLFESRLQEVDSWVSKNDLLFLAHFKHSIENSFTEAHLEYVNSSDSDQVLIQRKISYLKKNHVVRSIPGIRRLVIHPLIVYHSLLSSSRDKQLQPDTWLENTCNRYTYFLGRVLMSIEANMQEHGRKGLVFAGLIQEGPNVKYIFQMALHCCNANTYQNFVKVAITASNYILKIFPREAETFYWSLYNSAKVYGSPQEFAVIEAFLGQAIAEGTGISEGKDWTRANQYLSSAIEHLSTFRNSYFLGLALTKKAIIFHRQGKYEESLELFDQAIHVLENVDRWALGEQFVVPEHKIDEEMITLMIHMNIPIIFTGRNKEARRRLDKILKMIQNFFENHPEIATLLNLIGLTEQRGNRNKERALMWYKLAYNERMYWAKACPEPLLPVLNNIGMIYFYQDNFEEAMRYLKKALAIRRECGWTHYTTGLTLVHLAEMNLKIGNVVQAYKTSLEAERIFAATVKDHDMRLRVNFDLAHMRVLIRQALEPQPNAVRDYFRRIQSQESCEQDERTSKTRYFQGRNHGAEGSGAAACTRTMQTNYSQDTSDDSVTSSQLFGAGCDSQQDVNASYLHHHHQNSEENSQPFPAHEDILRMSAAEIEPCDLRMSPGDYFERILTITGTLQGTLSDDGLSNMLCSHEHLMLLNLGNSPEKFEEHWSALSTFSEANPWLEVDADTDTGVDSKYRCLIKHKPLYSYVLRTPYEQLDIKTFVKHLRTACLTCNFVNNAYGVDTWEVEAMHCIQEREIRQRRVPEINKTRPYSQPTQRGHAGNSTVAACDIFVFPESNQNVNSTNINQVEALPVFQELLPDNSLEDGDRIIGLHRASVAGHSEVHRQLPEMFLSQPSLVSPRIANTQEEILKLIQSKKEFCSPSVNMKAEQCLPGTSSVCIKTDSKSSIATHGFLPSRTPVEQSYLGEHDPAWSSEDNNLPQSDTCFCRQTATHHNVHNKVQPSREAHKQMNSEQRKCHIHREPSIPNRWTAEGTRCGTRHIFPDNNHQNVVNDYVSNKVLPDISRSQLVLEKCMPECTSQSDSTSGISANFHSSTSEQKYGRYCPRLQTCKSSDGGKFSVCDYIKNAFNMKELTESEAPAGKTHHKESQQQIHHPEQQPSENQQVAGVQDGKLDDRLVALHTCSRSGLVDTRKPSLASPSSRPCDAEPSSENYLPLHVVLPGKRRQEAGVENQPQLQCVGFNKKSPDDSQNICDSGLNSASMHIVNICDSSNRRLSKSECGASSRKSRTVSSLSSSSSSHHACNHVTSTVDSGYTSEKHLTNMSKTRPSTCTLSGAKYHKTCAGVHTNQAFSDISFHSANDLPTETSHTNAMTKTLCGREHTQTDNILTPLGYIEALAQIPHFPDQPLCSKSGTLQHSQEEHPLLQPAESCQTDNQAANIPFSSHPYFSVLTENSNSPVLFREPIEQSWNETLVPDGTQPSAETNRMSESGYMFRQELLHLSQIRQCDLEVSPDSEELTLAENVKSSQS